MILVLRILFNRNFNIRILLLSTLNVSYVIALKILDDNNVFSYGAYAIDSEN